MRRIALMLAMVAAIAMVLSASPAWANERGDRDDHWGGHGCGWHGCDWDHGRNWNDCWHGCNDFDGLFGFPVVNVIDDINFRNVRERNPRDESCVVQDIDLDGWIAEWEILCYY